MYSQCINILFSCLRYFFNSLYGPIAFEHKLIQKCMWAHFLRAKIYTNHFKTHFCVVWCKLMLSGVLYMPDRHCLSLTACCFHRYILQAQKWQGAATPMGLVPVPAEEFAHVIQKFPANNSNYFNSHYVVHQKIAQVI